MIRAALSQNGRRTGILSDGTRVNVYRYQGSGDEWTAALHYPDGGYSALVMSGRTAEFDEHNVEGPHMGTLIPWDAVPGNIKRDIEQRAVESSMVANGTYGEKDIVHENGDVWVLRDKRKSRYTVMIAGITHSTSDSSYPMSADGLSIAKARADYLARRKNKATSMQTNGRGIYHETAAGKHDMVLHQDHRGSWRIDLVTSAGGNHTDVTGPNSGYGSPEEAFQAALDVQRTRGIRGKSHVWVADRDGGLTDYEPMEANGSAAAADGSQEDDYVIINLDRDANLGLYRIIRGGKWLGPLEKSANIDTIIHAMQQDAKERGVHGVAVFQDDGSGHLSQVGNMVGSRYQESGGYQGNGRVASPAKIRQDLEASYYFNERKIADAEEELRRPGISAAYRQQMRDLIESSRSDMEYARGRMEPNGRATTVDPVAARELDLYIANSYELIGAPSSIGKSIDANLRRKLASGKYDSALAPKAWQHLVDEGAKRYQKEFGSGSPIFNAATRRQVAVDFARAWDEENGMTRNASKKTIRFVRAGQVERWVPSRRGYVWHDGYSEDGNTQPFLTRREAQESAKSRGARAVFDG